MRTGRKWIPAALGCCMVAAVVLFALLSKDRRYETQELPETAESLDSWSMETSVLNGQPLKEDKSIYSGRDRGKINYVYITVFPTKDENGDILTFKAFDRHTARNKDYNPILDANVVFGSAPAAGSNGGADNSLGSLNGQNVDTVNSTIRVRGNSARGEAYKSYKIKFKEDAGLFDEQSTLNLNKHVGDVSKITNKFCMDIMAPMEDMASFRTDFMIVYIRDASLPKEEQEYKYYGLYTQIEQPNKSYLRVRGLDTNGSMYKANNFEFRITDALRNTDDPLYDEEAFEDVLKIREGKDHTKVLQMLEDVNDMNKDFEEVFSTYFNEENYLTWMASNILLGNEDTIAHNFIIYSPKDSLTWYLLPWDYDGTFKFGEYASSFLAPPELKGIQRMTGVLLHRRYFRQPGSVEKLTAKVDELLEKYFAKEQVDGLVQSYLPVMEQVLMVEPDLSLCDIPPNEYTAYVGDFHNQIMRNYESYLASLKYPLPVFVSEPVKKSDGGILFAWEPSYDFEGDLLSYGIKVAEDAAMTKVIFEEKGLTDNTYVYHKGLSQGTYYLAVSITDEKGNTQYSLDSYQEIGREMQFGVRQFAVE